MKPSDDSKTVSTNTTDPPIDNPSNISKPATVSEHFLTSDHSANDITLIPLELLKSVRKARKVGNLYEAENELLYWFSALFKLAALVGNGHYPSVQYQDLAVRSQGKGNLIGNAVLSMEVHVSHVLT